MAERKRTVGDPATPGIISPGGGGQFSLPKAKGSNTRAALKQAYKNRQARKSGDTPQWKEGYYDHEPGGKPASSDPEYMRGWNERANE